MNQRINLTPEQQIVVDAMIDFLDNSTEQIFTLKGVAGTGKTTCVKEVVRGRSSVIGATISHSAKFVLQESLDGLAQCFTIAQLLGMKQNIDEETGKISFIPLRTKDTLPIDSARVIIIDECSMIDEYLFTRIMSMKPDNAKVLFMGDPFQLAPIEGKDDSITFNYTKGELLTPVRYTGPIADLGNRIREEISVINDGLPADKNLLNVWQMSELNNSSRTSCVNAEGSGYVFLNDVEDVVRIALKSFQEETDSESMRLIAYKNAAINKINNVIRTQLYSPDGETELLQFMPGELIICDGGYAINNASVIYNNQTFKVLDTLQVEGPNEVPSIALSLSPPVHLPMNSSVITVDWENGHNQFLDINRINKRNALEDGRQWPRYYNFRAQWAWFNYAYAISSHKSQGRTFTDAIIFETDIFGVKSNTLKNKLQALYVACTRAKRRVYIYNSKYRCDQSLLPESLREELGL